VIQIYFDDVLIDDDSYSSLYNAYDLFAGSFELGSVTSNLYELSIDKEVIEFMPKEIVIKENGIILAILNLDSCEEEKQFYNFTLLDAMVLMNFDYDASSLIEASDTGSVTLLSIVEDICNKVGIKLGTTDFNGYNKQISWYDSSRQAREYISYVAELNSGYATIGTDGRLYFLKQKKESIKRINIDECGDFSTREKMLITRVVYDDGLTKYEDGDTTGNTLYLNSSNVFITSQIDVSKIYNDIKGFEFYIVETSDCPMDSSIRAGDIITFVDDDGTEYSTIANYKMNYGGGWVGNYYLSVNNSIQNETKVNGTNNKIRNVQTTIDRVNNQLSIVAKESVEAVKKVGDLTISVNEIKNQVDSVYNFEKKVSGKNTIYITDAVATYVDYFEVIANQLQANYNFFGRFFFGRIFSRKGYDSSRYLTVYVDTSTKDNPTENLKIYTYDLVEPLRGYKGRNDRFVIENVQGENGQYSTKIRVYRNVELVDGILKILDEEIIQEIEGEVIKFNNGDNYLYVNDEYITNKMNVTFANNTELNKWYATKVELGSAFTITDEKITSEVSKKVGYDEIKSAINQSAEEIKIQAKDISLEGLVTANGYFKILEDGSFEAINGTFSGDIYLGDGKVISENGLMTNLQFRSGGRFYDYDLLGFNTSTETWANYYSDISLDVDIPSGFVITNAVLTLYHTPIWWWFDYQFEGWGSAKNLKLYKTNNPNRNHKFYYGFGTEYVTELSSSYLTEISGAFGTDSYTPSNTSDNTIETKSTINLKNYINSGNNKLIIRTAKSIPSMPASGTYDISVDTGMARAVLNITGYTKFNL